MRQEAEGIRRYCHLATGNYNVRTAGVYSDVGLFTCRDTFGQDLTELFNLLTGYTRPQKFHHLLLAPMGQREDFLAQIRREADHAAPADRRASRMQFPWYGDVVAYWSEISYIDVRAFSAFPQ